MWFTFCRGILNLSNAYPYSNSSGSLLASTQSILMEFEDELSDLANNIEISTNTDLVQQQYTILQNFYYNDSNTWLYNITYSSAQKLVL